MREKPQRIAADPEGFEAVFDEDTHPCNSCAFNSVGRESEDLCAQAPCGFYWRPEQLGVHFVRIKVQS